MGERRYYICDSKKKVRLKQTHRSLERALARCRQLNQQHDLATGGEKGRYFCGDWCDVKIAARHIDETREWPWAEEIDVDDLKNMAALCRLMIRRSEEAEA
ncbi:MAG: hypothetical protein U9Q35_01175 [Pseudomonadota bacterium]|nr:hypothetical protein [Pseudomonadota bacterium]